MEEKEPVSPTGEYLSSESLSLSILAVLEFGVPFSFTSSRLESLVETLLLPSNPRCSCIMLEDEHGQKKQWKRVKVNVKDHLKYPNFPTDLPPEAYDRYIQDNISNISTQNLPKTQPLWEIHVINYPTSSPNVASSMIFKFHHAIGDGFSLIGLLLSCLRRAGNPSLPLTYPSVRKTNPNPPNFLSVVVNTVSDLWKSVFVEDDVSPIRSGLSGVEFRPIDVATVTLSLDDIKQIKAKYWRDC